MFVSTKYLSRMELVAVLGGVHCKLSPSRSLASRVVGTAP